MIDLLPVPPGPRLADWRQRLARCRAERERMVFAWGEMDCLLFAADVVQALRGVDPAAAVRGRYASPRTAYRLLRAAGGLHAVWTRCLGQPVPGQLARVGDICVVPVGRRQALAVCNGATLIGPGPCGIAAVQLRCATQAWRV